MTSTDIGAHERVPLDQPDGGSGAADALARSGFAVRTDLGQHFLRSAQAAGRLVERAELAPGVQVLEVGAGLGTLSAAVARAGCRIWAVEKDERLRGDLTSVLRPFGTRARVSIADVRSLDLAGGLGEGRGVLLAILPFDGALAAELAVHVFACAPGIERGLLVVPGRALQACGAGGFGGSGLMVEEVDGISRGEFWPPAPGVLRVVSVRRSR